MTSGPYGDAEYPQQYPPPGQPPPAEPGTPGHAHPAGYGGYPQQPYPQQPYPGSPYQQPPGAPGYAYPPGYGYPQPRNGMGTASLVLGIIGLVFCWALWIGWVLNALAIIFGGVGISRANHGTATNKGAATAGLVMGIVGLVVGLALLAAIGTWEASWYL